MKITEHIKATPEEFFDFVDKSLLADIAAARGKKAKPSNLHEGYTYKKFLRGKADAAHAATVRIVTYDRLHSYRSSVTTGQGTSLMGYDIEPSGDGIDVTYVEDFEANGGIRALFSRVAGFFQGLSARSRVKAQLQALEGSIIANRYPEPEEGDSADGMEDGPSDGAAA